MLVGIGATAGDASLVSGGMIEPADMEELRRLGAIGELLGHFFDVRGRAIETELTRRIVTLPLDRLRNGRIVAVAGGAMKVRRDPRRACERPADGLITDERTARAIVEASGIVAAWRCRRPWRGNGRFPLNDPHFCGQRARA